MPQNNTPRPLSVIADEIRKDWSNIEKEVSPYAEPYLKAMETLNSINENYGWDSGESIVLYFLSNASTWRGEVARKIKVELKSMLLK